MKFFRFMAGYFGRYMAPSPSGTASRKRSFFGETLRTCLIQDIRIPLIFKDSLLKPPLLK